MQMCYVVFKQCDNQYFNYQFNDGDYQCQQQVVDVEVGYLVLWKEDFDKYLQYYQLFEVDVLFQDVKVVVVVF